MRSSIACARCRRSKVKCVNNGVNTTCRACETTGRECTYPTPAVPGAGGAPTRRDPVVTGVQSSEGAAVSEAPKRQRIKKSSANAQTHPLPSKESPRAMVDALDPTLLTTKVWQELFDIFQLHFSTDLPFIHPPTFLKPLRQSGPQGVSTDFGPPNNGPPPMPNASPVLLLAFLALTARFHPQLVAYHSPATSSRPSNPVVASEYYSSAAKCRLAGNFGDSLGMPTLERTQALLMLGLHEWGMCQGVKAWISIGVAVRSAQVLGLQFEQELDDMPLSRSLSLSTEARHMGISTTQQQQAVTDMSKGDAFVQEEVRRRTFWSCFLMDRYLSSGKYRPQMLNIQDLRIQLPSSDRAFLFGEKVRTLLLGEELDDVAGRAEIQSQRQASVMLGSGNGQAYRDSPASVPGTNGDTRMSESDESARWEIGADEGVLSRFIKVMDLYGKIVKWSCSGGRRREQYPPWDERCLWFSLQKMLTEAKNSLPRDLTLSSANTSAHITSRTSTPYMIIHSVLLLCSIILHREYVPFIPLRCAKPQGPLDPPMFPPSDYKVPPGFWEESARECFRSARNLIDLLRTCQEWGVLVETPIVGFATYTVAFVGVYAINFPWMDPDGYMCKKVGTDNREGAEAARKALEIIGQMRRRLQMADGWFRTIKRVHLYFSRIKKDFRRNTRALAESTGSASHPENYQHLSLREGGGGGGLEEYKLLEKTLKEFGSLEDGDLEMPDADRVGDGSDTGSTAVKSEAMDLGEGTPDSAGIRQERWNAINTVAAAAARRTESNASTNTNTGTGYAPGSLPALSHTSTPPSHSGPFGDRTQPYAGNGNTIVSPPTTGNPYDRIMAQTQQQAYGSTDQAQQASNTLQQQVHGAGWDFDMKEQWLNSLDTRFGGDDIAAFVAGNNWEDWAGMAASAQGPGGWLSTVWRGAVT